ncbi:T-complex protein 1 subunit beta [Nematocida homosporus]|uniref:T-complex protein 1 subunit beta n=1 Tax=Nematocida homosporus TaxID=1912981 RepID=UPI00221E990E|nr:T-complex protein 1 subunit beta [Nematocida homosporus]KAI5185357.1 T-complex protein 1 subunit beta [Nematocida homosporus]
MSTQLLRPGATQEKSDEARTSFLVGAITVSNMIKSTLGPSGMLKLLYNANGEPIITNDGATVLKNIVPNGPSAKILINSAQEHGANQGDGTTTLTILTGELLQEADRLIFKGAHPYKIIIAYRQAFKQAITKLRSLATTSQSQEEKLSLAKTTLSSKFSPIELESLSQLAVDLSTRVTDIEMVNIIKIVGGEISESHIDSGLMLECDVGPGQKTRVENPKVLVVNTALDTDKIKIFGAKASVTSPKDLERLEEAERQRMSEKVAAISKHADVIVNRQIIYDYPTQEFTKRGKVSVERADFTGVEMLSKVLDGSILSTFDEVSAADIGSCALFERLRLGGRVFCRFSGLPKTGACTVVIRGPTKELLDEAERSLIGAAKVLMGSTGEYICGGGSAEAAASCAIAGDSEGERAFARALMETTRTLAENAGHSSDDTIDTIIKKNKEGVFTWGVGAETAECMEKLGVKESLSLKEAIWTRAAEATEMLLRCDGIIKCKPRERVQE